MANFIKNAATKFADVAGDVGGWMNIVENVFKVFGRKPARPADTEAGLKAGFMGISKNDEALFWDAVAQAFPGEDDAVIQAKSQKIRDIFTQLNHSQKKRLLQTVGINEQAVVEMEPKSVEYTDNKGNQRIKIENKEKKYSVNERGKRFIQFLARLDTATAVGFLKESATLTGPIDDLTHFWSVAKPFLADTWNSIEARRRTQRAILWYLESETIEGAEARIIIKEMTLTQRQQQTWREREAQRPREFRIWLALIAFSVAAFIYVFALNH